MPKPVHITSPRATSEEVSKRFRIPKRRQRQLEALASELMKQAKAEQARPGISEKEENRKDASAAD